MDPAAAQVMPTINFMVDTALTKGDLPGTHKDMGPSYGKRDPYYSHHPT